MIAAVDSMADCSSDAFSDPHSWRACCSSGPAMDSISSLDGELGIWVSSRGRD